jgi:hypothetical protein
LHTCAGEFRHTKGKGDYEKLSYFQAAARSDMLYIIIALHIYPIRNVTLCSASHKILSGGALTAKKIKRKGS